MYGINPRTKSVSGPGSAAANASSKASTAAEAMPLSILGVRLEGVGFGLGFSVRVAAWQTEPAGEFGWGRAASTHFWISPKDDLFVIALQQFQPLNPVLLRLKPIIYEALADPKQ